MWVCVLVTHAGQPNKIILLRDNTGIILQSLTLGGSPPFVAALNVVFIIKSWGLLCVTRGNNDVSYVALNN